MTTIHSFVDKDTAIAALTPPDYVLTRPTPSGFCLTKNAAAEVAAKEQDLSEFKASRIAAAYLGCRIAAVLIAHPWAEEFTVEFDVTRAQRLFPTDVNPASIKYVPGVDLPEPSELDRGGRGYGRGSHALQLEVADGHFREASRRVDIATVEVSRAEIAHLLTSNEISGWAVFSRLYPQRARQLVSQLDGKTAALKEAREATLSLYTPFSGGELRVPPGTPQLAAEFLALRANEQRLHAQIATRPAAYGMKPSEASSKAVRVVVEAFSVTEGGEAPKFATYVVDEKFLANVRRLREVCERHKLSEARVHAHPEWGPGDIADELRLQDEELVVNELGSHHYTALPEYHDRIELRALQYEELQAAFEAAADGDVIYPGGGDELREAYEESLEAHDGTADQERDRGETA